MPDSVIPESVMTGSPSPWGLRRPRAVLRGIKSRRAHDFSMRFLPIDDGHDAMTMRLAAVPRGHGKELRTEQTRRFVCTGEQTSTFTPLVCENQIVLVLPLSLSLSLSQCPSKVPTVGPSLCSSS